MSELIIIIMAGGLGKRMNSTLPKVLHTINDEPMLVKIVKEAQTLSPTKIYIVVGHYHQIIKNTIHKHIPDAKNDNSNIIFVYQEHALGTGHAVMCCRPFLINYPQNTSVLILSGDVPLLRAETMQQMTQNLNQVKMMTTTLDDPTGYGRIILHPETNDFQEIKEEKDCTEEQRVIGQVNCGIYAFECRTLCKYLPKITKNNAQNEYYFTDLIAIVRHYENISIEMLEISKNKQFEIMGVNTQKQLEELANLQL